MERICGILNSSHSVMGLKMLKIGHWGGGGGGLS